MLDLAGEAVVAYSGPETPAIVGKGAGQTLLALTAYDDDPAVVTNRIRVSRLLFTNPTLGQNCTSPADCGGGDCVDGVCCDSACGNGDLNDCQACSVALGAAQDGICVPLANTKECRASNGSCDLAELCDGTSTVCPVDVLAADATSCDDGDLCTENTTCLAGLCGAGGPKVCTALNECHAVGSCDPANGICDNPPKPDGAKCSVGTCQGGVCSAIVDVDAGVDVGVDANTHDAPSFDLPPNVDAGTDSPKTDGPVADSNEKWRDKGVSPSDSVEDFLNTTNSDGQMPKTDGSKDVEPGGCDCSVAESSGSPYYIILLGFLFLGRRRKRAAKNR